MPYERLLNGRWSEPSRLYLVSTATFGRRPLFSDFKVASIVAREIRAREIAGDWENVAWVVMPDHLHLLVAMGTTALARAVGRLKGRTSRMIGLSCGLDGPVWEVGYHDHAVRREEDVRALARYVCANPIRAGIVTTLRDYPFWDACWLGEKRQAEA